MPAENVTGNGTAAENWLARHIADEDTPPPVADPDLAGIAPALADPDDPVVLPSPAVVESDPAALAPNAPDLVDPAEVPSSAVKEVDSTGSVPPASVPSLGGPDATSAASPAAASDPSATSTPDTTPPPAMPEPEQQETKPETEPAPDASASTPDTAEPKPATQEPMAASTGQAPAQKADGWEVDPYYLRSFTDAVERARSYLDTVRTKVNRMQGVELTPQLGTSPVGQQLAKKFDDRLNSPDGLRARLAEAMKRMENFVTSAEKVARTYEDPDQEGADRYSGLSTEASGPPGKS